MTKEGLKTDDNVWSCPADLAAELDQIVEALDYSKLFADHTLVLFGEYHANNAVREHLAKNAENFRQNGVTHYAVEAKMQEVFNRLNADPSVDLGEAWMGAEATIGPVEKRGLRRASYQLAARAMVSGGIRVIPIDMDLSKPHNPESRERYITQGVIDLFENDPEAILSILIGADHVGKRVGVPAGGVAWHKYRSRIPPLSARLLEAGLNPLSVCFNDENYFDYFFPEATRLAGLVNQEFMIDLRPYHGGHQQVFSSGNFDWVIHLPQEVPDFSLSQA